MSGGPFLWLASLALAFVAGCFGAVAVISTSEFLVAGPAIDFAIAVVTAIFTVLAAVLAANITNWRNTENARRQSEALLLRGDLEEFRREVVSLRRHAVAAAAFLEKLDPLVTRYSSGSEPTRIDLLIEVEKKICDVPLPKELDQFSVENDPLGLPEAVSSSIGELNWQYKILKDNIKWATNENNLSTEVRERCFEATSAMRICCLSIGARIRTQIAEIESKKNKALKEYSLLRDWDSRK